MTIVTERKPSARMLSIGVWIKVGSLWETPKNSGYAHFVEHMLFKGTKHRNAFQITRQIGDRGGTSDAWTCRDHTGVLLQVLKDDAEFAMDILSDMVINPKFSEEDIKMERKVVLQEIEDEENDPELQLSEKFISLIYPNQPIGTNILGSKENIRGISSRLLKDFHHKYYVASNIVLSATGNISHREITALAEKYFANLPTGNAEDLAPARYEGGFEHINPDCNRVMIGLGFNVPFNKKLETATILLSQIMGTGDTSRLYTEIREKRGLAYDISCNLQKEKQDGVIDIFAECNAGNVNRILQLIAAEIKKLKESLISEEELSRVKKQLIVAIIRNMELGEFSCQAHAEQIIRRGKPRTIRQSINMVENVTREDIRAAAREIFATRLTYVIHGNVSGYMNYEKLEKLLS